MTFCVDFFYNSLLTLYCDFENVDWQTQPFPENQLNRYTSLLDEFNKFANSKNVHLISEPNKDILDECCIYIIKINNIIHGAFY